MKSCRVTGLEEVKMVKKDLKGKNLKAEKT